MAGWPDSSNDQGITLNGALYLENLKVEKLRHIYGNGYDITIGSGITNPSSGFYLYGAGRNELGEKVGKIAVYSGHIERIVGYVRSTGKTIDVENKQACITVGGTANVVTIIAGCANGGIENGNVKINVEDGNVTTLVGGNQGFGNQEAAFSGKQKLILAEER